MRVYRLLLHLLPASFREEYGEEMARVFARQRRDAPHTAARAWLWVGALGDILQNSVRTHLDVLRQDLRQSVRTLRRSPAFSLTTIIVTALGVGATTAAFTLTDFVLVRPLPFPNADQLVKVWQGPADRPPTLRGLAGTNDVSPGLFFGWRRRTTAFSSMGAFATTTANLTGMGEPQRLEGTMVSYDALSTVGIAPAIGRPFQADDDREGVPCVVLISDGLWRRHLGGDRAAMGARIRLDDESCEVIGVMPPGFDFPNPHHPVLAAQAICA
jgi:putative ABC transport system permease protein